MHPELTNASEALAWLAANDIRRVELVFADMTSIARGKTMSTASFASSQCAKMPSLFFGLTVTGGEPPEVFAKIFPPTFPDMKMAPDWRTLVRDPLAAVPTATVICNLEARFIAADGSRELDVADLSPRQLLQKNLDRLAAAGYRARVAPELEFFLVHPQRKADGSLQVAHGMSAPVPHIESSHDLGSAESAASFAPFFDELWAACEVQGIPICGYGHESAIGQYEVNFAPGEPMAQADAVFRFKRLTREVARRHGCYATFMAKPYALEPGNGLHWHISLADAQGNNPFTANDGSDDPRLGNFVGGWQASARASMAILAPYMHSYQRLQSPDASPESVEWGYDNRTAAFRVPQSDGANRRLEHRLPGGDANPYLSLALMLGTGLSGMQQQLSARAQINDRSAASAEGALPMNLAEALDELQRCPLMAEALGRDFIALYDMTKRYELSEQVHDADFAFKHLLHRS